MYKSQFEAPLSGTTLAQARPLHNDLVKAEFHKIKQPIRLLYGRSSSLPEIKRKLHVLHHRAETARGLSDGTAFDQLWKDLELILQKYSEEGEAFRDRLLKMMHEDPAVKDDGLDEVDK